ncbi:MAG: adenine phosphoribosyltransferase [Bacteroidota bacterium]
MLLSDKIKATIRDVVDYPKPGIVFKDITPVLANPALVDDIISHLVADLRGQKIDAIAAVEARGFIFGSILAHKIGCSFIPVRKAGKLPFHTRKQKYDLEYGTAEIEIHNDAITPGLRVLIHDDLLATGGTAGAAAELVKASGGELAGFSFLINLSFLPGEQHLTTRFGLRPHYLVSY